MELSAAAQADLWNHDPEFVAEFQQQREKGLEAQLMSSSELTATAAMGARRFISCSRFRTRYEQGCTDHRSPKSAHWIAAGSRRSTPRASRSMRVWPNGASPLCAWSSDGVCPSVMAPAVSDPHPPNVWPRSIGVANKACLQQMDQGLNRCGCGLIICRSHAAAPAWRSSI